MMPWLVIAGAAVYVLTVVALARRPMWALYGIFFTSAILKTPELPVVGDKAALPELSFLLLLGSLVLGWATGQVRIRNRFMPPVQLNILLLGLFFVVTLVSFFSNNIEYGRAASASLLEVIIIFYGVILFVLTVFLIEDWEEWERCFMAWAAGMALVGFIGAYSVFFTPPAFAVDSFSGRVSSTLKFENQVPSYVMPLMPVLLYFMFAHGISRRAKWLFGAILLSCAITLIGTGSRTAFLLIIAMGGLLFLMMLLVRRQRVANHGLMGAYMAVGALAVVMYVVMAMATFSGTYKLGKTPAWQRPVVNLYTSITQKGAIDPKRAGQFEFALENFDSAPFVGHGPRFTQLGLHHVLVHNTYLTILLEMGVLGFTFFLAWLLSMLWLGISGYQSAVFERAGYLMAALAVGMLLLMMYQLTMYGLRHRPLWLMAGLLVGAANLNLRDRQRT